MQTLLVFVFMIATSFGGVVGAGPGEDLPIWARWMEPFVGQRRERGGRQFLPQLPLIGSSEDSGGLGNIWNQFGNQWQQPFNQWQQPFGQFGQNQFGQNQFGNNERPNEFGQNPDQSNEDRYNQNQRPNQFEQNQRPNQFGQNQRPNQSGQNQFGQNQRPNQSGQNQFGQNQRPNQSGQNQSGQNQRPNQSGQNQFGQNQRPNQSGQNQFGQNQRPNQSGQNQFGQNQRPNQSGQNQRPNQSGQNQSGQNQRPNQSGQNQFGQNQRPNQSGQNQRPNQSGQNQSGQNQRPNQSGQNQFGQNQRPNQSGQNQRPNQRPNEQEFGESNQRPGQFGQGSQEVGEEQYVNLPVRPGESCRRDNKAGICTRIYQCQEVVEQLQNNRRPPAPCYIPPNDSTPYVCCLDTAPTTPTTKPKPSPTQPTKPRPQHVSERLSKRKCKEYSRLVFEKVESPALFESAPIEVDRCVKSAEGLIVGGIDAALGEFPHMALLGYGDNLDSLSWECGGSLISEDYILTAAHCVAEKTPSHVLLGELVLADDTDHAHPQLIPIADRGITIHPEYRFPSNYYDVALLLLSRRPTLGPYVRPACLHTGEPYPQGSLIASGWGRTEYGGDPSQSLMKVNLNEVGFEICNKTYRNMENKLSNGIRNNQQICAGRLEGGKDTCQGDSGGPLQVFRTSPHCTYDIVGIVSFGKGCALRNTPGVYARVKFFLDWIERTVWPNASG